jgi:hypothetical protein
MRPPAVTAFALLLVMFRQTRFDAWGVVLCVVLLIGVLPLFHQGAVIGFDAALPSPNLVRTLEGHSGAVLCCCASAFLTAD